MKLCSPLFSKTEVNRGACPGEKKKKKHKLQATSDGKQRKLLMAYKWGWLLQQIG